MRVKNDGDGWVIRGQLAGTYIKYHINFTIQAC